VLVAEGAAPARTLRVLVVEDQGVLRNGLRWLLSRVSWVERCAGARSADEALLLARSIAFDVALVDVDLGAESGFDVAHRLAGLPHGGPPVVLISAESGSELVELVDASGALGFVSKPDLSGDTIRNLLAHADSER